MMAGYGKWIVPLIILILLLLLPRGTYEAVMKTQEITDHVGRTVSVPSRINKVYGTTQEASFLIYAIEPQAIIGWNRGLSPDLEFFIQDQYHHLPTIGTWNEEYETAQISIIKEIQPDLVIHLAPADLPNMLLVEEIQTELEIPTILIDSSLLSLPAALRLVGNLLDKEIRGNTLAVYAENTLQRIETLGKNLRAVEKASVYVVSETDTDYLEELLAYAGIMELPKLDTPQNPDFMLVMPHTITDPYRKITHDPQLAHIGAIADQRVYEIPTLPLNWLGPNSLCRLLGVEWLISIAYPAYYSVDFAEIFVEFMDVFYEKNVSPEMLHWIFERSGTFY